MTVKEKLEKEITELKQKCEVVRKGLFFTEDGKKKSYLNADEWVDVWRNRTVYLINDIKLISVDPKSEYSEPCLRFIIAFEDDNSEYIDVYLPEK